MNNITEFENIDGNYISYFCKVKLGLFDKNKILSTSYRLNQVIDYHEEAFLEHIKKHMQSFNEKSNNLNSNIFNENFPMQEVLCEIKNIFHQAKGFIQVILKTFITLNLMNVVEIIIK